MRKNAGQERRSSHQGDRDAKPVAERRAEWPHRSPKGTCHVMVGSA